MKSLLQQSFACVHVPVLHYLLETIAHFVASASDSLSALDADFYTVKHRVDLLGLLSHVQYTMLNVLTFCVGLLSLPFRLDIVQEGGKKSQR